MGAYLALSLTLVCASQGRVPPDPETQPPVEFSRRVEEYVQLHRRLEHGLPPERPFVNPDEMMKAADALAEAIRRARPNARAGDIFSAESARWFTTTIAETLSRSGYRAQDVILSLNDPAPGAKRPVVNGRYDWRLGASMWPGLLQTLPPLPRELEYRIVDADLVLIDLRANLVVDMLENAMGLEED